MQCELSRCMYMLVIVINDYSDFFALRRFLQQPLTKSNNGQAQTKLKKTEEGPRSLIVHTTGLIPVPMEVALPFQATLPFASRSHLRSPMTARYSA